MWNFGRVLGWKLMIFKTSGSTATKTAATLRVASTTTHGRNLPLDSSLLHLLIAMLFLRKVSKSSLSHPSNINLTIAGYKEYHTDRIYMARMGDWRENKDIEIPLDGVGGVSIIVKADVHRAGPSMNLCPQTPLLSNPTNNNQTGINFPSYAFENHAETEGFAKMARRAGYQVYGLPNYVVWHVDTDEKPGNA